jgi:hypothetical protein
MTTVLFLINAAASALNFAKYADNSDPTNLGVGVFCGLVAISCAVRSD